MENSIKKYLMYYLNSVQSTNFNYNKNIFKLN